MSLDRLEKLYISELRDLYSAENQLLNVDRAKEIFKTAKAEDISTVREPSAPKRLND